MNSFSFNSKYIFCLAFAIFFAPKLDAVNGKYPLQNFTPSEYKAGIQNIDFAQNRDMEIFVANNLGVLSFNGHEWKTQAFQTGKKKRSLAFDDNNNRLYVGSQGEFGYFHQDWNYVSLLELIPSSQRDFDEVWDVFLINSEVYFFTFQGIYVYDGTAISVIDHQDGFNRSFQANGKLFTQSSQGKLLEVKDGELVRNYPQGQANQIIAGVIAHNEGYLLFYNSGDIEFSTTFGFNEVHQKLSLALKGKYVNHVLPLSDTRLVISTQTAGLFLYDLQDQSIEVISTGNGLLSNACLRTFQDYVGNLWVGMQNGIAIIDINSPMLLIGQEVKLEGSGYDAFQDDSGTYYTTSNGIYFLANDATQCQFLEGTEGPAYSIQRITGKLYAGHHTGLFLLENGKAQRLASTDGLWQVKQLQARPEYAVGGTYSGLYLFKVNDNRELQALRKISGFNESSRFFEEDQAGRIWVGQFYKGLYRLELWEDLTGAIVHKVSDEYDLPIDEQIILSKIDNELHIATNAGVYKLDHNSDSIVPAETFSEVIGDQPVYLLVQDRLKNIYFFTENLVGFYKQISASNYVFVPSSLFHLRYSFNNDLLNVSTNVSDGILFNANKGFIHYNPELEDRLPVKRPLMISKVRSVAEDVDLYARQPFHEKPDKVEPLMVSPKARVVQFVVEAFQYNMIDNQQFRYFLKGFDDQYGEWTPITTKEYTNLREGDYEFYVQTTNYLGEVITSEPLMLKVEPPIHRSLGAKILYIVLVVLAIYFVGLFQQRKFKRNTRKIEKAKQLELAAKQQELLQLKEEKMKNELRHVNNQLAASTMNLVVKNEFMENIKEELKQVKQNVAIKNTKQALEQIVKEIDTTLRLQEDWEQFEYHFDQVHGDFLDRMRHEFEDLTPSEHKLCAFLRLNLNTKEIANLMGISFRGVEIARYRLRKKLGLVKGQNLSKFILEY